MPLATRRLPCAPPLQLPASTGVSRQHRRVSNPPDARGLRSAATCCPAPSCHPFPVAALSFRPSGSLWTPQGSPRDLTPTLDTSVASDGHRDRRPGNTGASPETPEASAPCRSAHARVGGPFGAHGFKTSSYPMDSSRAGVLREGRERATSVCERTPVRSPPVRSPGGQARHPGRCPVREWGQRPVGAWDDAHPTEPLWPGWATF